MNLRRFVFSLLVLLAAPAAPAADIDDLYVGEAPVADQSAEARAEALEEALGQVLVRASGDPDILEREAAADLLSYTSNWVLSYGYEEVEKEEGKEGREEGRLGEAGSGGETAGGRLDAGSVAVGEETVPGEAAEENPVPEGKELRLRARFDGTAVERALRRRGLPVWGSERPRTLVLLVIEGEADIVSRRQADEVAEAMRETARRRGVPLVFPERGGTERRTLRAADIRYGDLSQTRAAVRDYRASHVLVGRVERIGAGWRGEWTLSHRGETVAEWNTGAAGREEVLTAGTRRLADNYARRFAVYGGAGADTVIAVAVDGVAAVEDYVRVGQYLRELTSVKTAIPVLIDREAVVFRVQLSGDPRTLTRGIGLAEWLHEDELARNLAALYAAGGRALGYRLGS